MARVLTEYRLHSIKLNVTKARRRLKEQAIAYKGGSCEVCGFIGHPSAFDFHHTDPKKKDFQISSGSYRSFETLRVELDKTQLLCANCHRTYHGTEHEVSLQHREAQLLVLRAALPPRSGALLMRIEMLCRGCGVSVLRCVGRRIVVCSAACAAKINESIDWPSDEALRALVWQCCQGEVAKKLGVRARTVALRCKARGISTPPVGYWSSKTKASVDAIRSLEKIHWPTDDELNRLVWEGPVLQLARRLGVSDVAVKKRCRTRNIPTPPRGHWAKQASVATHP